MLEDDLKTLILTGVGLAAIPVHLANVPQTITPPKITLERISVDGEYSNDGPVDVETTNLQINCIASTATQARTIAQAVKDVFHANMLATVGATRFGGIFIENEADHADPVESGREKPTQMVILSVRVNYYA